MFNSQNELSWSKWAKTPTEKYLESIGYYNEFIEVWSEPSCESLEELYGKWPGGYITMLKGIKGDELISIRKSLSAEYMLLEGKNSPEVESLKTGASIGYDWLKKNKKN